MPVGQGFKAKNLTTDVLTIHNADSDAGFATECRTGTDKGSHYVKAATTSR